MIKICWYAQWDSGEILNSAGIAQFRLEHFPARFVSRKLCPHSIYLLSFLEISWSCSPCFILFLVMFHPFWSLVFILYSFYFHERSVISLVFDGLPQESLPGSHTWSFWGASANREILGVGTFLAQALCLPRPGTSRSIWLPTSRGCFGGDGLIPNGLCKSNFPRAFFVWMQRLQLNATDV